MVKNIFKEVIITLLLILAILLVLGVLFYEYIPSNKVVPEKIAYTTPENVAAEVNSEVTETQPVNITYQLDNADLQHAKKTGNYDAGKKNPFEAYEEESQGGEDGNTNTSTNSNTSSSNTNSSNDSGYFPNTGTK